jgi:hypothetical protein
VGPDRWVPVRGETVLGPGNGQTGGGFVGAVRILFSKKLLAASA